MKKNSAYLLSLFLMTAITTACNDTNDSGPEGIIDVASGFYTINGGNKSGKIPASITSYEYSTGAVTDPMQDAFMAANGIALGDGAQKAIIYGSKMYICMYTSNVIWVTDPVTLKIIDTIRPEGAATNPRDIVAADGKVYVSMYSGYVSRIDTLSLSVDATVKVGPNPEQLGIAGGKLYVANSDGSNSKLEYPESSISVIDLASLSETKIKDITKILNPTDIATNGSEVFVICRGNYSDKPSTVKKVVGNGVVDVVDGTHIAVNANNLYVINAPYGGKREDMTFKVYDTTTLQDKGDFISQTAGTDSWVDSPNAIAVDPVEGNIVILSYTLSSAGDSQYREPCYANIYAHDGSFTKRIKCGVGAAAVTFVHKKVKI